MATDNATRMPPAIASQLFNLGQEMTEEMSSIYKGIHALEVLGKCTHVDSELLAYGVEFVTEELNRHIVAVGCAIEDIGRIK